MLSIRKISEYVKIFSSRLGGSSFSKEIVLPRERSRAQYCLDLVERLLINRLENGDHDYDREVLEIKLPAWERPTASIVICVHNNLNYTLNCLYSLSRFKNNTSFEVVLIDDQSTDNSPEILPKIKHIKYFYNQQNLGFLRYANLGAGKASGEYLVFLNNDTVVADYWLDNLINFLEENKRAGMAGSKLVYPDGSLQEAGAGILCDGSAWQWIDNDPLLSRRLFATREVDYCSGASLAIKKEFFMNLGMFDEYFAPCYYEDVDLAFRVRRAGSKVFFVDSSILYHFEGVSHGRDLNGGLKKYQLINKEKFVAKWQCVLSSQPKNILEAKVRIFDGNPEYSKSKPLLGPGGGHGADKSDEPEIIQLKEKIDWLNARLADSEHVSHEAWKMVRGLEKTVSVYRHSLSWRITKPLRAGHSFLMMLRDKIPLLIGSWAGCYEGYKKKRILKERKTILVIDHYIPETDRDAGSVRMFNLLKIMVGLGYRVVFWGDDGFVPEPYTSNLRREGVEVYGGYSSISLEKYLAIEGLNMDIVILSRSHIARKNLPHVKKYCPNSLVVYDTVDLAYLRESRQALVENNRDLSVSAERLKAAEYKLASACDLTIVVSENERLIMKKEDPDLPIEVIPTIYTPKPNPSAGFSQKRGIFFIGGFKHHPNIDAVKYFVSDIFPLIEEKIPGIMFYIIGSHPPEEVMGLSRRNVFVTGHVPDVSTHFDACRLAVAPIRYGAGVKGKINHSMSYGIPTVTTSLGAEGMNLTDGFDVLIADRPQDFADKVVSLYLDEKLWKKISENSLKNIEKYYHYNIARDSVKRILNNLLNSKREKFRQ